MVDSSKQFNYGPNMEPTTVVTGVDRVVRTTANVREIAVPELGVVVDDVPVTNALWQQVMGDKGSNAGENSIYVDAANPDEPRVYVSWLDAIEFVNERSRQAGLEPCYVIDGDTVTFDPDTGGYYLPTEEEWQALAMAGTTGNRYGPLDEIAVYDRSRIDVVRTKAPNAFGLYDMIGLVWEWTSDTWDASKKVVPQELKNLSREQVEAVVEELRAATETKKAPSATAAPSDVTIETKYTVKQDGDEWTVVSVSTTTTRVVVGKLTDQDTANMLADMLTAKLQ